MRNRFLSISIPIALCLATTLGATEASADQERVHLHGDHPYASGGSYVQTGDTHAGSPVYVNEDNGYYYLFQRADGTWYVDSNVGEDPAGTVSVGPTSDTPFDGAWDDPAMGCIPTDAVMVSGSNYADNTSGPFEFTGEIYNDAPVYTREAGGSSMSLYRRSGGYAAGGWVIDVNGIDDDWSGTIDFSDAADWPWEATWGGGSPTTAMTDIAEVDVADCGYYSELNTGSYVFTGEIYNEAPVYQLESGGYTVSVYRRADYRWYLDYNEISEDWDGTVDHALDPSWWPWEATYYNGCTMTDSEGDPEPVEPREYILVDTPMNSNDAQAHCESLGTNLATITNYADNDVVADLCEESSDLLCHIGINDLDSEGVLQWRDATPIMYEYWYSNDHAGGGQDCATISGTQQAWMDYGAWQFISCGSTLRPFICDAV